jgi:hypothetical protein
MALDGLTARLFGVYGVSERLAPGLWPSAASLVGTPLTLGMTLVALGTAWFGAVCALAVRLEWGYWACLVLGAASLLYLGPGTVLGAVVLVSLVIPATRRWVQAGEAAHES